MELVGVFGFAEKGDGFILAVLVEVDELDGGAVFARLRRNGDVPGIGDGINLFLQRLIGFAGLGRLEQLVAGFEFTPAQQHKQSGQNGQQGHAFHKFLQ